MSAVEALLLGIVQGLTEFFPVSSSGQLFMLQALRGSRDDGILFEVTVHVATLASVLIFYRARVAELAAGVLRLDPDLGEAHLALGMLLADPATPARLRDPQRARRHLRRFLELAPPGDREGRGQAEDWLRFLHG